jgi:cell division protease FtsH
VHLKKIKSGVDVDPAQVAALTPGFTGADLANLVNEAAVIATRRNATSVSLADFTEAIERVVAGPEKRNRLLIPRERRIVAFHEMGHTIVAMALPDVDPIKKVSIIPRGIGALGYSMQMPLEDRYLMTRGELLDRMTVLLGGRAAEMLIFNEATTGAADDLERATEMARAMVTRYGMSPDVGQASFARERSRYLDLPGASPQQSEASDQTSARIDEAISAFVEQAFERATAILRKCAAVHQDSAERLLEKESFSEEELAPIRRAVAACARSGAPAAPEHNVEAAIRTILARLRQAYS